MLPSLGITVQDHLHPAAGAPMHSIADFIATHADQERNAGPFEVENRATLQINLQGTVYAKSGAMAAYRGDVKFSRKGALEDGVGKLSHGLCLSVRSSTRASSLAGSRSGARPAWRANRPTSRCSAKRLPQVAMKRESQPSSPSRGRRRRLPAPQQHQFLPLSTRQVHLLHAPWSRCNLIGSLD
jgi:hypothetical protein